MNFRMVVTTGAAPRAGAPDPETRARQADDAVVVTHVELLLEAATTAKAAAVAALEVACAQAAREKYCAGSDSRLSGEIHALAASITDLDGEIEWHTRTIAGLQ
jgi:hypothetical protein